MMVSLVYRKARERGDEGMDASLLSPAGKLICGISATKTWEWEGKVEGRYRM
jgi:hypothetical protein